MLSKNQAKLVRSLQSKKQRSQQGLFVAEGNKTVLDLIEGQMDLLFWCATPSWLEKESGLLDRLETKVLEVDPKVLSQISSHQSPQGLLGVFKIPEIQISDQQFSSGLTLMLDKINDPGNLGTLVRIADWFGIQHVVCSPDCVDVFNPKSVSASMGSLARIQVHYTSLVELFQNASAKYPGIGIYGAILHQPSVYEASLPKDAWLVLGSESHGVSEDLLPHISHPISIPAFGGAESLNVATAGAILCSEFKRNSGS